MNDDLKSDVAVHGTRLDRLEDDLNEIKKDIRAIRDVMMQARGGWKTVILVGGVAGSVGAAIGKFLPFLATKP
jgi:hypothetical protein